MCHVLHGLKTIISILYTIIPQQRLEIVLRREAGVAQIPVDFPPVLDATVKEQPQIIRDDERHNVRLQALPKQ